MKVLCKKVQMRSSIEGISLESCNDAWRVTYNPAWIYSINWSCCWRNRASQLSMQCLSKKNWNTLPSLFEFLSGWIRSSGAHKRTLVAGKEELTVRRSTRRQQLIIDVGSWRFYNQQDEVLNQKSLRVIDSFFFNNLAVDNAGQTADNKHTGSMIFAFFLLGSRTDKTMAEDTFQNQSVKLICWQAFSFIRFFNCFFLFSFQAEIDAF